MQSVQHHRLASRMTREIAALERDPPFGICVWMNDDSLTTLNATIVGIEGTPYEHGIFRLEVKIPDNYPLEPPNVAFVTPIFHPNVDESGRICLDTLVMPPKGAWRPALGVGAVLTSIQQLMNSPNPDDGLDGDVTRLYRADFAEFRRRAVAMTKKYAVEQQQGDQARGQVKRSPERKAVEEERRVTPKKRKAVEVGEQEEEKRGQKAPKEVEEAKVVNDGFMDDESDEGDGGGDQSDHSPSPSHYSHSPSLKKSKTNT